MNDATQNPQGSNPGGQHDSSGGTRVPTSVPLNEQAYMVRLNALGDDDLAVFVRRLDTALKEAHGGPPDDELNDVITVAANARTLLRNRRARAAGDRAKTIVRELLSTGINE